MLKVGDSFSNPKTGATLEVTELPGDGNGVLEVRRLMKGDSGKTVPHIHLDYVETFIVEQGQASAQLGGETKTIGPGEELSIPLDTKHVNGHNAGNDDLVIRHRFAPASDFALSYVETIGPMMMAAKTDKQGEVALLAALAIAHKTNSQSFPAGAPPFLMKSVVFPLGALIARARGYDLKIARVKTG